MAKLKTEKSKEEGDKAALETLLDVVALALANWPETMFPNKFVSVLYDLSASQNLPFVKELASDVSHMLKSRHTKGKVIFHLINDRYLREDFLILFYKTQL